METASPATAARSWTAARWWLGAGAVLAVGVWLRLRAPGEIVRSGDLWIQDNDTARRLARLAAADQSASYPFVETFDGFPDGCIGHWTQPMDWFLRALDPLVRGLFAGARPHEAAAVCAGPLLAAVATLVLMLCVARACGPLPALAAGLLHTTAVSFVNVSGFGNGDHQTLQHVLVALAFGLPLATVATRRPFLTALLAGAALGAAIWVSAELQMLLLLAALVLFLQELVPDDGWAQPRREGLALGIVGMLALGHVLENPGDLRAFEWDRISWFQLHQGLVLLLFAALPRFLPRHRLRPVLAAAIAIAAGLLPFLVPAFRSAFAAQLALGAAAVEWTRTDVSEFRSAFAGPTGFSWLQPLQRFGWLLLALPLFAWGAAVARTLPARTRVLVLANAIGTLCLALAEVKLAHLFALAFPFLVAVAADEARRRAAARGIAPAAVLGAVLAVLALGCYPVLSAGRGPSDAAVRTELCDEVFGARLRADGTFSVLAPWGLGAQLLWRARAPVVASGYHRNLEGIRDHYRILVSTPADDAAMRALLQRRRVRYVVVWFDRMFLRTAPVVLHNGIEYVRQRGTTTEFTPACFETLYWRLRYGKVQGFELVYTSKYGNRMVQPPEPMFRVFEVR